MEGVTAIAAIIAGVLLIAIIGLTTAALRHQRCEAVYWQRLHRELLLVVDDIQNRHNALLKYRHVQKIVSNIEAGKARKVKQ